MSQALNLQQAPTTLPTRVAFLGLIILSQAV